MPKKALVLVSPGHLFKVMQCLKVAGCRLTVVEDKLTRAELYEGLMQLPDKQLQRLYAHYFLGRSVAVISISISIKAITILSISTAQL